MTTGIRAGASASENRLAYIKETAWGATPATPGFSVLRMTSESFKPAKNTVRSQEIDAGRNVKDEILTGFAADGSFNFELSYGTYDDFLAGLFFGSWSTNSLVNSNGVGDSFSFERRISLPSGSFAYNRFRGQVPNEMSLQMNAGELITGSFGFMGQDMINDTSIITGATYAAANSEPVMSAATQFGSLAAVGIASTPRLRQLSLNVKNNLREQRQLGVQGRSGIVPGRFEVTGQLQAYFENLDLFNAFLNHTDVALNFVLGSTTLKKYKFWIPTLKLTGDPGIETGGNDQDVMATMNFTAILDRLTSVAGTLKIDRAVA